MTLLKRAGIALACALVLAAPAALAQKTVSQPGTTVPQTVVGYGAPGTTATPVTDANGLPVNCISGCGGGGGGGSTEPFTPAGNATLAASTTSSRVALPTADDTTLLQNTGSVTAYVAFGSASVTATTTSTPVPPGMAVALDAGTNTHLAAITASGSTTLTITTGVGLPAFGLALDNSSPVPVSDNGGSITVDGTVSVTALPAGTNNIGDVDVLTLPALPAGANTIGTVNLGTLNGAATAAKQPALGTAGTPSADVITVQGVASMTPFWMVGNIGNNAADNGNPVKIGCVFNTSPTTISPGNRADVQCNSKGGVAVSLQDSAGNYVAGVLSPGDGRGDTTDRKLGVLSYGLVFNGASWDRPKGSLVGTATQPYGIRSSRWNYAAASGGILNTTTAVTIAPAVAGLRNCLVTLDLSAEALGTATEFAVRDGAGGTVIYRTKIGTAGIPNGRTVALNAPICGAVNTLMEVVTLTATGTGAVYANATGNLEP